jgi:hypothetical protein
MRTLRLKARVVRSKKVSARGEPQTGSQKNGVRKMKAGSTVSADYFSDPIFLTILFRKIRPVHNPFAIHGI